jgi:hypothetical protein
MFHVINKHFEEADIYTFFDDLAKIIPNAESDLFLTKVILVYFLGNAKGDTADIIYNLKLKSQHPPNFMSALDVLIERGERAGREQGILIGVAQGKAEATRHAIAKAIFRGKLTDAEIAEDNDTTIDYVHLLRTELQNTPPTM